MTRRGRLCLAAIVLAPVASLAACSAANDPEVRRMYDTLPVASSIGGARHLAHWLQEDLKANTTVTDADKADLRARAQILAAQADSLDRGMESYDRRDPGVSKRALEIRTAALDVEYRTLMREWMVWQVRHGLRPASEVGENADERQLQDASWSRGE